MFSQQLYLLPLSFIMIFLFIMTIMAIILYLRTKKNSYLISALSFFVSMLPFWIVSFKSINEEISMFSPAIPLIIGSLILVQGTIYYLYSQRNKKNLLFFLIPLILVLITGSTSLRILAVIPFLLLTGSSIVSYVKLSNDILKRNHYIVSILLTILTGLCGVTSVVLGLFMLRFLFSSFLALTFIIQFIMFFERIVDLMHAASYTSVIDGLTGLYNRRYYTKQVEQKAKQGYIGVVFCDIDNFKALNDTQGHHIGDKVLKEVSIIVQELVKGKGLAGRYGGEEIVLLINDSKVDLERLAEEVRARVESHTIVTLSVGFATNNGGLPYTEVIKLADKYMYESKVSGKNRVTGQI